MIIFEGRAVVVPRVVLYDDFLLGLVLITSLRHQRVGAAFLYFLPRVLGRLGRSVCHVRLEAWRHGMAPP